jgi:hypothetical protein
LSLGRRYLWDWKKISYNFPDLFLASTEVVIGLTNGEEQEEVYL